MNCSVACRTRWCAEDIVKRCRQPATGPMVCSNASSPPPRGNKTIADSDVGQTFLSAGSGDFPVPGFRVKPSDLVREVGKLRNRQARKPALQIWATRFLFNLAQVGNESAPDRGRGVHAASTCETKAGHAFPASHYCGG